MKKILTFAALTAAILTTKYTGICNGRPARPENFRLRATDS